MYKISNEKLPLLFAAIAENMDLYMPLHKQGVIKDIKENSRGFYVIAEFDEPEI